MVATAALEFSFFPVDSTMAAATCYDLLKSLTAREKPNRHIAD